MIQFLLSMGVYAQQTESQFTQNIRGVVTDAVSGSPLAYVTITIQGKPGIGTATDEKGSFTLTGIPIGRHSIQASYVGYETYITNEILVTSSKEVYLEIPLTESSYSLDEVVVKASFDKDLPLNKMALTGGHMLTVEEASRFAGGLDDPARLVSSFAGVASTPSANGISVHGNAPHLLQWKLEEIEIPNPNHFADIATLGGGILSSLSGNVLGNSDFFSGAFPAEYGNAVSGVFDMKLRNGNTQNYEHAFQLGTLGIDFESEGPINRKKNSSYIVNYRYSMMGLMGKIDPDASVDQFDYQDLNFRLNFPTQKSGTFSIWGTALVDSYKQKFEVNPELWEYFSDKNKGVSKQYMASGGLTHRYFFNENTFLRSTLASTYSKYDIKQEVFNPELVSTPYGSLDSHSTNIIFNTSLNSKLSSKFTNKTGLTFTNMLYKMDLKLAPQEAQPLETISKGDGDTYLISAYSTSSLDLSPRVTFNFGLYAQMLTLNNHKTIEPRASIRWNSTAKSSIALAYGMHSRMEKMDVYFVKTKSTGDASLNKDLDFTKVHHAMLSYNYKFSDKISLRFEPYFQYLYNVPVIADSSYSVLNRRDFYVENQLINTGNGMNYGLDVTLERYLNNGYYYLVTGSIFSSRYCGGDGIWHNTKYNRNYIANVSGGKEWIMGKNKNRIFSVNLRMTLQGGDRYSPVDVDATMQDPDKEVHSDEANAFSKQFGPMFLLNYTISYKVNKKKISHEFGIKALNAFEQVEYGGHQYNFVTNQIEANEYAAALNNLYYKIEF